MVTVEALSQVNGGRLVYLSVGFRKIGYFTEQLNLEGCIRCSLSSTPCLSLCSSHFRFKVSLEYPIDKLSAKNCLKWTQLLFLNVARCTEDFQIIAPLHLKCKPQNLAHPLSWHSTTYMPRFLLDFYASLSSVTSTVSHYLKAYTST